MTVAFIAMAAAGCYILAAIKVVALFADRSRSLVLREYAIAQASVATIFTLLLPPVIAAIDQLSANVSLLLNSLIGIVCLTAGQTILVASAGVPDHRRRGRTAEADGTRRTVRRWWTACLIIVVVRTMLFIAAPAEVHTVEMVDFAPNYARYPTLAAFNMLRIIWFTIIFANMWRGYRAYARQESSGPTRWGLTLHSWAGLLGLGYVAYQLAYMLAQTAGHPLPGVERQIGVLMLLCVVATLLLATAILYLGPTLQARRTYRALRPLWQVVAASRDGAVLDDRRFSPAERLIRRRQENIDGLTRLRNHYELTLWQEAYRKAHDSGLPAPRAEAIADAATIVGAMLAHRTGHPPANPPLRYLPSGPREAEIGWQIAVGKALTPKRPRPRCWSWPRVATPRSARQP
ncbi:DUF6545 domain-containing protein [Actinoplanes regularis]|uniref:DUF6545 domain-containing protein n=1 Tax=Actinoplanes regularis TaxID=52697 RepID=A0A239D0F5_9ACTN|nr:DUF6545 domain-containing protein [Actinoplanes regularis]GIE88491.1 hypothetical protein Are01nite_49710 [Actinoplanes regularis]SNS25361.1 hypothetical protein SAMN06264365_112175 [Actinoplanes regularis]